MPIKPGQIGGVKPIDITPIGRGEGEQEVVQWSKKWEVGQPEMLQPAAQQAGQAVSVRIVRVDGDESISNGGESVVTQNPEIMIVKVR